MDKRASILEQVDRVVAQGPFDATWESLTSYTPPDWYLDGKFGIFIHWGIYCVPAFGSEWYPREMYRQGTDTFKHHVATYGPQDKFGYKDFIPQFHAQDFDAAAWAQLFADAGARFVVPVAEHHDGFAMYATDLNRWNAAEMGPKQNICGELADEVRNLGMVFGCSSHRAEHFWFFDGGRTFPSDVQDPAYEDFYGPAQPGPEDSHDIDERPPTQEYLDDWLARTCELVSRYRPQLVWFDWWIHQAAFEPYLKRFAAFYYNSAAEWGKGVAINYKYHAFPDGAAVFDVERGQLAGIRATLWQNDTSVSRNSWGYVQNQDYKTPVSLIQDLVDIVSKNGALLLNIGPRPDGTIPEPEQQILREIGAWLRTYGDAIYNTRPWRIFGEGPTEIAEGAFTDTKRQSFTGDDLRYTAGRDALYVVSLGDSGGTVTAKALGTESGRAQEVILLGHGPVAFTQDAAGLKVQLPGPQVGPFALRIAGEGLVP